MVNSHFAGGVDDADNGYALNLVQPGRSDI